MNGMTLTLVAQPSDPMLEAHRLDLGEVLSVKLVDNKLKQLKVTVVAHDMNENGEIIPKNKLISVQSINVSKATFNLTIK